MTLGNFGLLKRPVYVPVVSSSYGQDFLLVPLHADTSETSPLRYSPHSPLSFPYLPFSFPSVHPVVYFSKDKGESDLAYGENTHKFRNFKPRNGPLSTSFKPNPFTVNFNASLTPSLQKAPIFNGNHRITNLFTTSSPKVHTAQHDNITAPTNRLQPSSPARKHTFMK